MKTFIRIIIVIVAVSVIAGFFIVDSPSETRLKKFDEARIGDLQTIQWEIINFWQLKGRLPVELSILEDSIRGFMVPSDPETRESYEYKTKESLEFVLCAVFAQESRNDEFGSERIPAPALERGISYPKETSWSHSAGRHCFERIIDPDLYSSKR